MKRFMKQAVVAGMVCLLAGGARAQGTRMFKSIVFPGMGQLGDGQKVRGIAFMASEVVLLHVMFAQISRANAYAYETQRLQVEYDLDTTWQAKTTTHANWTDAADKASTSQTAILLFAGLAGACWAANVVDAVLFAPRNKESAGIVQKLGERLALDVRGDKTRVGYTLQF